MIDYTKYSQPQQTSTPYQQNPTLAQKPYVMKKEEAYRMDILCMNCQQMVWVEEIDKHSLTCFKVSDAVYRIESNMNIKQCDFKLEKLKEALTTQLNQGYPCNKIIKQLQMLKIYEQNELRKKRGKQRFFQI